MPGERVAAVFSHPDDETFGPGGTLAKLARQGAEVHLLCATRGEAGTIGESAQLGRERLAEIRTRELEDACGVLGIQPPRWLDLPDGGLSEQPPAQLDDRVVGFLRTARPRIVLTFDPGGLSGHADHRTLTASVARSVVRAGQSEREDLGAPHGIDRLWYYSIPASRAERVTHRVIHAVPDASVDAWIDITDTLSHKRAAVAAHATQRVFIDQLESHIGDLEAFWNPEAFTLGWAREPLPGRPVSDLFAGL